MSLSKAIKAREFVGKCMPVPESGCWVWDGRLSNHGYGVLAIGHGRTAYAHRTAYEIFRGAIQEGLQIDHLCGVRCCVNPDHLEAVTSTENKARGQSRNAINKRKTECKYGHPFNQWNTYLRWSGNKLIGRNCKICKALAFARWKGKHGST